MLEGLDDIQWSSLGHAYGSATDVPQLLRDLAQRNAEVREEARDHLYGNLWHQGSVYEATAYAVPFLVELVREPLVQERHELLIYLALIHG
jgi:hypothetical protein